MAHALAPNSEDVIQLGTLTAMSLGVPEVAVALIDGPVAGNHPDLAATNVRMTPGSSGTCSDPDSIACQHGTFVAGILHARRGSAAPAICPGCTLVVRPVFSGTATGTFDLPTTQPGELASAIIATIDAGVRVINLSVALAGPSTNIQPELQNALDYAARRGVIVVAAAGNQGTIGSSAITRHLWVIPAVASDRRGRLMQLSNLASSIGRQGLAAPGDSVVSLRATGGTMTMSGTSIAAPFVSGAIALLWSLFPNAGAAEIRHAVSAGASRNRRSVVPPLFNATAAYQMMQQQYRRWRRTG
jgi:subtilisin family serine protease